MSWYRTYRPTTVAQLHLASVRQTFVDLMQRGNIPHALLFAGPKGTGKTSSARIIAAMVNDPRNAAALDTGKPLQEPDQKNELVQRIQQGNSFAVTELDAASNRGIDDIRALKERVFVPPAEGRLSVTILDEAHMLTTEAWNALLKLLEEPPAHAVFILATTELAKIPATIISRCTVVNFTRATVEELSAALQGILVAEKIDAVPAAVSLIAAHAEGSFRDAVKVLEQAAAGKTKLTVEDVTAVLHQAPVEQVTAFVQAIVDKKEMELVNVVGELRSSGQDPERFHRQLLSVLHDQLVLATTQGDGAAIWSAKVSHYLLTQFLVLGNDESGGIPFLALELRALEIIFKAKEKGQPKSGKSDHAGTNEGQPGPTLLAHASPPRLRSDVRSQGASVAPDTVSTVASSVLSVPDTIPTAAPAAPILPSVDPQQLISQWEEFLAMVHQKNSSVEALLRSAKPVATSGQTAQVEVYYEFHKQQLQQPKFRTLLDECAAALFGGPVAFEFLLADSARPGAALSTVSGEPADAGLIQIAKEILT